jgi:hypothetical protein
MDQAGYEKSSVGIVRSLSDIDRSTAANDPPPSASFSALHLVVSPSPRHEGNVGQAARAFLI